MLNTPALAQAVTAAQSSAVPLNTILFRSIHLRHFSRFTTAKPLFTAGGGPAGSRYIPPGGPAALYLAFDADTAHREGNQLFYQTAAGPVGPALLQAGGLRPDPVVMIGTHVRVSRLLDVRDPAIQHRLGIQSPVELLGPWKGMPNAPTQLLGDAVFSDNFFEGIIYPSAQNPGHACLVLFRTRLLPTSQVHFADGATGITAQLP